MRILGVDPGSRVTGWGLLGGSPMRACLLDCGTLRLGDSATELAHRLARLQRELVELVRALQPTSAAVESPFHGKNARSALQLAHARGVILAVLAGEGGEVAEYSPATVKKSVTGNGRAPKDQVRMMVGRILETPLRSADDDLSDALAVALCHASTRGLHAALSRYSDGAGGGRGR